MSFQEKRSLLFLFTNLGVTAGYSSFIYNRYYDWVKVNPNDMAFWGKVFLGLVPVMILAHILSTIIFVIINKIITNEDYPPITDERDKLIELKAIWASHCTFVFGFLLSMGSQALGMQAWVMFALFAASCILASLITEFTKFYLYRYGC